MRIILKRVPQWIKSLLSGRYIPAGKESKIIVQVEHTCMNYKCDKKETFPAYLTISEYFNDNDSYSQSIHSTELIDKKDWYFAQHPGKKEITVALCEDCGHEYHNYDTEKLYSKIVEEQAKQFSENIGSIYSSSKGKGKKK